MIYLALSAYAILRAFGETSWLVGMAWVTVATVNFATAALFALGGHKRKARTTDHSRASYEVDSVGRDSSLPPAHAAVREAH